MKFKTPFDRSSRTFAAPLGLVTLTLTLAACGGTGPASAPSSTGAAPVSTPQAIDPGDNSLTFEPFTSVTNGWGPVERNRSNGEQGASDGRTITLNGRTYERGFGTHAGSAMTFDLAGKCTTFTSDIGVDDYVGNNGSVIFQVFADGAKIYDSGVMTGASATKEVNVSVAGKRELRLVVTDAGNGNVYDHANWANPMVRNCNATGSAPTPAPSNPAPSGDVTYSGPLVITKGGTYTGNWQSTNPDVPAVEIRTQEPVVIQNSNVRGPGKLFYGAYRANVTIRNSRGYGTNPNIYGRAQGQFAAFAEVVNLRLENNYIEGTHGVLVYKYSGNSTPDQTVKIIANQFRNINGLASNGQGGYTNTSTIAHTIIYNSVRRIPHSEIAWNEVINEPGKSMVEEHFIMYTSSGTPSSPILIHNNYIQGAYNSRPGTDDIYHGGGILLGDGVTSNPADFGYANVYNNQIVSTTNQGLAITGGVHHNIYNNRVISSGRLPDGTRILSQNVGIYTYDFNKLVSTSPVTWANNSMKNNYVAWTVVRADGSTWNNPWWWGTCNINNTDCSGNQNAGTATLEMERQEYQLWRNKLSQNGVVVGPR